MCEATADPDPPDIRADACKESLAERCGLEPRTIQLIERGRTNLSIAVLISVAHALGVDARSLLRPGKLAPARPGRPKRKVGPVRRR